MSFQQRFPENNAIWDYSNPIEAQKKAFQIYGKSAILYRSKAKDKKYSIINPAGKIVNFGQMKYSDYTLTGDDLKRSLYLKRSANIKGNWKNDAYSPNNLSRNILW